MNSDIFVNANDILKLFHGKHFDVAMELVLNVLICLIIFKFINAFTKKMLNGLTNIQNKENLTKSIPIIARIIKIVVLILVIACFLESHGYSITSLVAGLGITGIAVGFAAQETISNIFGSLSIFHDKAYKIGDYIIIGEAEGIVEDINLRSTFLRALDHSKIIVPNGLIAKGIIQNVTDSHKRRISELFEVTYETSDDKLLRAKEIIKEVILSHKDIHKDIKVFVEKLDASSINIRLVADVKTNNYYKYAEVKDEVILEIIKKFRSENIEFAYPTNTVYVANK